MLTLIFPGKIRQINIKNQIYFYNNQINLKDSDASMLKIDKKKIKKKKQRN